MITSESLEWALMTIRDKLKFGLDEPNAIIRREMRVKGVLVEAVEKVKELEKEVSALRRALKSHGEIIELNSRLVLELQELKIKLELSQEL